MSGNECFLTLNLMARGVAVLPQEIFLAKKLSLFEFIDDESPHRIAMRSRLTEKLDTKSMSDMAQGRFRYRWSLSSDGKVNSDELADHLHWMLSVFKAGRNLTDLDRYSIQHMISCFWRGNGTGGGPLLSPDFIETLNRQRTSFAVGCYCY
jgi:hypothetical protein